MKLDKNNKKSKPNKILPDDATQGIPLFKGLEILWKSQDARPLYIVKDPVNHFIIAIYPPGGTTIARSMLDSYNKIFEFAESESEATGDHYTIISFHPSDAKVPRVLSYGASIREAISLGRRLFKARKLEPIMVVTNSRFVIENIRIFGNTIVWINSAVPTQKIYDFVNTYNKIRNDENLDYNERLERSRELLMQSTELFARYAGDIKNEDLPL